MNTAEALQYFDEGPDRMMCCGASLVLNSQDGVSRIYCPRCKREVREVAGQWVVHEWGERGIQLPRPPEAVRLRNGMEIWRAHDILSALVTGEIQVTLDDRSRAAAHAALDALCWVLRHDHNPHFAENLAGIEKAAETAGYRLRGAN